MAKGNRTTGMRGFALLTSDERKANASRAGLASARKRREMRDELEAFRAQQAQAKAEQQKVA